ncbi:hypothetical protein UPYG_G00024090, partial [Umbra pygmaea]
YVYVRLSVRPRPQRPQYHSTRSPLSRQTFPLPLPRSHKHHTSSRSLPMFCQLLGALYVKQVATGQANHHFAGVLSTRLSAFYPHNPPINTRTPLFSGLNITTSLSSLRCRINSSSSRDTRTHTARASPRLLTQQPTGGWQERGERRRRGERGRGIARLKISGTPVTPRPTVNKDETSCSFIYVDKNRRKRGERDAIRDK